MSKSKKMTKDEVLETCIEKNQPDDLRRHNKVRDVITRVCDEYGKAFGISPDEVFEAIESERTYWAVNYYQDANFPLLDNVTIYETIDDFRKTVDGKGFRCPRCSGVSTDPYACNSGDDMEPGKTCDWKSFGLFGCLDGGHTVLVKSEFPAHAKPTTIFMPVTLAADKRQQET